MISHLRKLPWESTATQPHITIALALLVGASALAQPAADGGTGESEPASSQSPKEQQALVDRLDELEERLRALEEENQKLKRLQGRLGGYGDLGFFWVQGDGSGIRTDLGHQVFPQYQGSVPDSWVFLGDPLSTAVNSRGEPADTGESRAVVFDSVGAGGRPSFLLNAFSLSVFGGLSEQLSFTGAVDLVPRSRDSSDPRGLFVGDFLDVKLAYAEYIVPFESFALSLFAGKFDAVLGIEYRSQDAADRLTVTPSLICRYTCGRPVGLKARGKWLDDALVVALAVTNGSSFVELFPFGAEGESNNLKTVSGRLSYAFPVGGGLELGVSGAIGPQDFQPDDSVLQWHYGADARLEWRDLLLAGEFVTGRALGKRDGPGPVCGAAPCLFYRGAYGLVGYRATNELTPYVRIDWRDATHRSGASFVYESKVLRATVGMRAELTEHLLVKAEYVVNRELEPLPQFPDDVLTSSLVVRF